MASAKRCHVTHAPLVEVLAADEDHPSNEKLVRDQARQVSADVANYATGGAIVIDYPVQNGTC